MAASCVRTSTPGAGEAVPEITAERSCFEQDGPCRSPNATREPGSTSVSVNQITEASCRGLPTKLRCAPRGRPAGDATGLPAAEAEPVPLNETSAEGTGAQPWRSVRT